MFWGNAFGNVISENRIENSEISVFSLFGMLGGSFAPSFNNRIEKNTLIHSKLIVTGYTFGLPIDVPSVGNVVKENKRIDSDLLYEHQEPYPI
jgi:hypothetical protein